MSGRLEREPTEVGQAYIICSLSLTHTLTHAHKSTDEEGGAGSMFENGCHISAVMHRAALCSLKAWLSGAVAFISMHVQKVPWKLFMALKILIYCAPLVLFF